jgi:hypothetical protein
LKKLWNSFNQECNFNNVIPERRQGPNAPTATGTSAPTSIGRPDGGHAGQDRPCPADCGWLVFDMDATLITAHSDQEGAAPQEISLD